MKSRIIATLLVVLTCVCPLLAQAQSTAQSTVKEDFTGVSTTNNWFFYNGACLTAGTSTNTSQPGVVPGCTSVLSSYYNYAQDRDSALVGGYKGCLGGTPSGGTCPTSQLADPVISGVGHGALRFTNGSPFGHAENGAIVSGFTFPTGQGLEITFKTVSYLGDSGGAGGDGADGMSFYLLDGCMPLVGDTTAAPTECAGNNNLLYRKSGSTVRYPGIGAWGGSLAYTCSNANPPYDGLVGGYIGVGIDEYGNFLNGTTNTLGEGGTSATGDNTASGGGYQPGRIGLRAGGNISWLSLNTAYGANPNDTTKPYYPISMTQQCGGGSSYFAGTASCNSCPVGTYNSTTGNCDNALCPAGWSQWSGDNQCYQCRTSSGSLDNGRLTLSPAPACTTTGDTLNKAAPSVTASASTSAPDTSQAQAAVRNTCSSGHLWNYANFTSPADAGTADLSNTAKNTAKIMDYSAVSGAYSVLSGVSIAAEGAATRDAATPIFYDVKITPDGKLTFSYSISGSAYNTVIKNQDITTLSGDLPASFRFGFAGSTGGSTNIHEIMCFRAAPSQESGGSTSINEKQSSKVENGTTQAYFGFYNPTPTVWTGDLTANALMDDGAGNVSIATLANWSASCLLTGVPAGGKCAKTGVAAASITQTADTARIMLTYDPAGAKGIPFLWGSLTSNMQGQLGGSETTPGDRLSYLRGSIANEGPSLTKEFRQRDGILADIVDSSPTWVGPPEYSYTGQWVDRRNVSGGKGPEVGTGAQTYLQFVKAEQTRQNVVYIGANDGFVHGFRAGAFDAYNNYVGGSTTTPNDGSEAIAYMPNAVLKAIHSATAAADFSGKQYGHVFYVDGTPGTGDLFYNNAWHTWIVGGLGAGGTAIYALDVTDPNGKAPGTTAFSQSAAQSLVIGEWDNTTITCPNQTVTACGANLGNTFGTPIIRRLHNRQWAIIFGNGYGSSSSDAGVFIGVIDATTGKPTFYYLSTGYAAAMKAAGVTPAANGIGYVSSADLDGDHITDYLYAGDLQGNVWRFDLTAIPTTTTPSWSASWGVTSGPVFSAGSGLSQPITSAIVVSIVPSSGSYRVMLGFGTGQRKQLTNTLPTSFTSGTQSIYGVWDWNMGSWNSAASAPQYVSLTNALASGASCTSPCLTTNQYKGTTVNQAAPSIQQTNLMQQTFTASSTYSAVIDGTNNAVCWANTSACASPTVNNKFGWYANLPGGASSPTGQEQVIFNPTFYNGAFIVDSTVPAASTPTTCDTGLDKGYTYLVSMASGGTITTGSGSTLAGVFQNYSNDTKAAGAETDATGTPSVVTTAEGTTVLVYQKVNGAGDTTPIKPPSNTKVKRLTWIQLR